MGRRRVINSKQKESAGDGGKMRGRHDRGSSGGGIVVNRASRDICVHMCSPPTCWLSESEVRANLAEVAWGANTLKLCQPDNLPGAIIIIIKKKKTPFLKNCDSQVNQMTQLSFDLFWSHTSQMALDVNRDLPLTAKAVVNN